MGLEVGGQIKGEDYQRVYNACLARLGQPLADILDSAGLFSEDSEAVQEVVQEAIKSFMDMMFSGASAGGLLDDLLARPEFYVNGYAETDQNFAVMVMETLITHGIIALDNFRNSGYNSNVV